MRRIYFDTETTSVDPYNGGQIFQLAYFLEEEGKALTCGNYFFKIERLSEGSALVTGRSLEEINALARGTFADSADELLALFAGSAVYAQNFRFDYHFMQAEMGRLGKLFRYRSDVCTAKAFAKAEHFRSLHKHKVSLEKICNFCGLDRGTISKFCREYFGEEARPHDARYDASALCLAVKKGEELGALGGNGQR